MLEHAIELSKLLPSLTKILVGIVDKELDVEDTRSQYESTYANSAWVVGACANSISERPAAEWADLVDLAKWITRVVEKWGWSGRALEGLASLIRARYTVSYITFGTC